MIRLGNTVQHKDAQAIRGKVVKISAGKIYVMCPQWDEFDPIEDKAEQWEAVCVCDSLTLSGVGHERSCAYFGRYRRSLEPWKRETA